MIMLFLLLVLLLFPAYSVSADEKDLLTWESGLGTAGELDGNIVLVSIFLSDDRFRWDFSDHQDIQTRNNCLAYLGIASDWISQNARQWGKAPQFIYDWTEDPQVYYETTITASVTAYENDPTEEVTDFISQSVNVEELLERYEADSVVFMSFLKTPLQNRYLSYTIPYDDEAVSTCEVVYLLTGCGGKEENPATYAHEILHAFGAPDLYATGNPAYNYNIDVPFMDYCIMHYPNEIMLTTCDLETREPYYDFISNELSHITAYYIGWTDECPEVEEFNLQPSQHILYAQTESSM